MITTSQFWFFSFFCFLLAFIFILYRERDPRFIFYFLAGSLVAFFIFEVPANITGNHFYTVENYIFSVHGIPITMTLAEGFCIAIAVYLHEKIPWFIGVIKSLKK